MPHTPGGTKCVLWVGGEPRKTTTVNGTVSLKPLYKGQVGSVRGTCRYLLLFYSSNDGTAQTELDDTRLDESIAAHNFAVLKQSPEEQLAQLNKALEKAKADVTEFTTLPVAGKADLRRPRRV